MPQTLTKRLARVRSTRDLRAEILDLAAAAVERHRPARLEVISPVISADTIQAEWERVLPAFDAEVRRLLSLHIDEDRPAPFGATIPLAKTNYTYELLRLLVGASLRGDGPQVLAGLMEKIGASQTPIRSALANLRAAELVPDTRRLEVVPEQLSNETLSRIGALPQTLRFRFERGAQIKSPDALLHRARSLLQRGGPGAWHAFALSGVPVAQMDVPKLDLIGTPRLDLLAHLDREGDSFDPMLLRWLDDGLEPEGNVLAPAPVVVTVVRARQVLTRDIGDPQVRCAQPMDVLMSLLDLGLRDQAIQYVRAMRE
ncbi:MAG: hypothetical protein MEQ07_00735 [Aquimonas sp.]|nr:hypothetical protein [Aquimonas sp.]